MINGQCKCPVQYTGQRCENVVTSIELPPPEKIEAQVEATVKVHKLFSEELQNNTSDAFKEFNNTFSQEMYELYKNITAYKGVRIISLSPGSVVVDYKIIMEIPYTAEFTEVFQNATEEMKQELEARSTIDSSTTSCNETKNMCFGNSNFNLNQLVLNYSNLEKECREKVGKELEDFFYVEYTDKNFYCISLCAPGFNRTFNCNQGKCSLDRQGPRCYCLTTDTHWYRGAHCEHGILKNLVYGLVGAAAVLLLVLVCTFLGFMLRWQKEARRQKHKVKQVDQWRAADDLLAQGSFQNMGFEHEEPYQNIPMNPIFSNFQPTVNYLDPRNEITIRRPHIRK